MARSFLVFCVVIQLHTILMHHVSFSLMLHFFGTFSSTFYVCEHSKISKIVFLFLISLHFGTELVCSLCIGSSLSEHSKNSLFLFDTFSYWQPVFASSRKLLKFKHFLRFYIKVPKYIRNIILRFRKKTIESSKKGGNVYQVIRCMVYLKIKK